MKITPIKKHRYKLCTGTDCLCYRRTFDDAEKFALEYSDENMETVRIFDRFSHANNVNLWEVRPAETWLRPIGIKQPKAA